MAFNIRVFCRSGQQLYNITNSVKLSVHRIKPLRTLASGISYDIREKKPLLKVKQIDIFTEQVRLLSTKPSDGSIPTGVETPPDEKKPGLVQKFKQMYRDYWYVLLPVHMATSAIWFGGFYYAVRSGIDAVSILEWFNVSEKILDKLRDSSVGYFALALALYKLATPLRYAVTVGGTTCAIQKLKAVGWIKPVPSRERIKEMIQEKKDNIQGQMKQKHTQVMEEMKKYKSDMRNMKNKVKKM